MVYREEKLGGLPPAHKSESLKTNGFQIIPVLSLSNSVACDRVFDKVQVMSISDEILPVILEKQRHILPV